MSGICDGIDDGRRYSRMCWSGIADAEDFAGDMDFKVTGTSKGITALQMDMKVHGLPVAILRQAIEQSKAGRAHILSICSAFFQSLVSRSVRMRHELRRLRLIQIRSA